MTARFLKDKFYVAANQAVHLLDLIPRLAKEAGFGKRMQKRTKTFCESTKKEIAQLIAWIEGGARLYDQILVEAHNKIKNLN